MSEINNPRQKGIAVRAFPAFWDRDNYYRRNSPLQVNSGVREWHDDLLQTARGEGCTIVRQVYTKMLREIQGD